MAEFNISRGVQANFDALAQKDGDTVYVCTDTGRCYLGSTRLSPRISQIYTSGKKVYYNGQDVTASVSLPEILNQAAADWYGTQGAYNELVSNGDVQVGILYHIEVQGDWSETNENNLGYIKNQPNILDFEHVAQSHELKFFYTKHNQVVPYVSQQQQNE